MLEIFDIYSYINMAHGEIYPFRTSRTYQYSSEIDTGTRHPWKGDRSSSGQIQYLQTSGLPLPAPSLVHWGTDPNSRAKDSFYCQIAREPDSEASPTRSKHRTTPQRDGQPSSGSLSLQGMWTWLERKNLNARFSWSKALTGCQPPRWLKLIKSWYRTRFGQRIITPSSAYNSKEEM